MAPRPPSHGVPRRCPPPHARPVGRLPLRHPPGPRPGLVTPFSSRRTPGPPPAPHPHVLQTPPTALPELHTPEPVSLTPHLDSHHTRRVPSHLRPRRGPRPSHRSTAGPPPQASHTHSIPVPLTPRARLADSPVRVPLSASHISHPRKDPGLHDSSSYWASEALRAERGPQALAFLVPLNSSVASTADLTP